MMTRSDALREIRDLIDYLSADATELRATFDSEADWQVLMTILETLRTKAGSVALERHLANSGHRPPPLPVARPSNVAPIPIGIAEWSVDQPFVRP